MMRTAFLENNGKFIGLVQAENKEVVRLYFDGETVDNNLGRDLEMKLLEVEKSGATREDHLEFGQLTADKFGLERAKPWAFDTVGMYDFIENS
jgi:hypothetical protein